MSSTSPDPDTAPDDGVTPWHKFARTGRAGRALNRGRQGVRAFLRDMSLPVASTLAVGALLLLALVVLYLTRRPWLDDPSNIGDGWSLSLDTDVMPWKDRLTYAAAVATATGAVIALVVNYRKQRDAEEGRFATLFAEAASQLGNNSPAVRIAGVYAIAALADRYAKHRQQCIDALCGYLRLPYDPDAGRGHLTSRTHEHVASATEHAPKITTTHSYRPEDREVRLTIIRIIRDHLRDPYEAATWCGRDLDFTGAIFDGGDFIDAQFIGGEVSFIGARFVGGTVRFNHAAFDGCTVNFTDAGFTGGTVNFDSAWFISGEVRFKGARFAGGTVNFRVAWIRGGTVNFDFASLDGGKVSFDFASLDGGKVSFNHAAVIGGEVSFDWAEFAGGTVNFDFASLNGGEVSFDQAAFGSGKVSFIDATFAGATVERDGHPFRGWPAGGEDRAP